MRRKVYQKSKRSRTEPKRQAMKTHIARGDTVLVIRGADRGKQGKVLHVYPKTERLEIEGVNIVKKHRRATRQDEESAIIEMPGPIHWSNVMLLDPKSGEPTRVRRRVNKDGTVERIAVKSGQPIPRVR